MRYVKAAAAAAFACVLFSVPAALAQNNAVKIGVLDDMSGPYAENTGPGDVAAVQFAIADFGGSVLGKPIELVTRRLPEQGRCRRRHRQALVGRRERRHDARHPQLGDRARAGAHRQEKNRIVMPTAAATSALTGKSCTRHSIHLIYDTYGQTKTIVNAIAKHGRRQFLVLRHRRLCLRPRGRERRHQLHQGGGRQGAGLGAPSAQHRGLLLLRPAGPGLQGQGPDVRQRRQRHHQRRQAGGGVRPGQAGHEASAPRWRSSPT